MLDFDRIKQDDNRSVVPIVRHFYSYDNRTGDLLNEGLQDMGFSYPKMEGQYRMMLYKYSRFWRPGEFRENPVDQRTIRLRCSSNSIDVPVWVKYGAETKVQYRYLNGNVLGRIATPLDGTPAMAFSNRMGYLLQRAEAKLSEPDLDVGLFFGELTSTSNMFRNPIMALGRAANRFNAAVKKARSANPRRKERATRTGRQQARRFSDSIANAWLTYLYGVQPLMADIEALRKKLQNGFKKPFAIRKKTSSEGAYNTPTIMDMGSQVDGLWWEFQTHMYTRITESASVYYYPLPDFGSPMAELGVSIHQIPRLLYNLTPYSFVLNWIIDFDTWLGAISPKLYLARLGSTSSRKSVCVKTTSLKSVWLYGYGPKAPAKGQHESVVTQYLRDRDYGSAMIPMVTWPLKNFERSLSAISLLWQKMPKPNTKVFQEVTK